MKERKKLSLAAKTFIGFGLGIVIGLIFGERATILAPLGKLILTVYPSDVILIVLMYMPMAAMGCPWRWWA